MVVGIILLTLTGAQFGPAATISILAITITKATPITLGALAGICSERTGVVNIGIEGLMLTSAFTGFMAGVYTHNLGIALQESGDSEGVDLGNDPLHPTVPTQMRAHTTVKSVRPTQPRWSSAGNQCDCAT